MNTHWRRLAVLAGAATAGLALWASPAGAHVEPLAESAPSGGVGHHRHAGPPRLQRLTHDKLTMKVPDGVEDFKPQPIAGWTLTSTTRKVDPPQTIEGETITETLDTVTWTATPGNALPDDQMQDFWFTAQDAEGQGRHGRCRSPPCRPASRARPSGSSRRGGQGRARAPGPDDHADGRGVGGRRGDRDGRRPPRRSIDDSTRRTPSRSSASSSVPWAWSSAASRWPARPAGPRPDRPDRPFCRVTANRVEEGIVSRRWRRRRR